MNSFWLISQVLRGVWLLLPEDVIAQHEIVHGILTRGPIQDGNATSRDPIKLDTYASDADSGATHETAMNVAIVSMVGTMVKYSTMCTDGTEDVAALIQRAAADDQYHAVILRIDSGGGSISAIPPLVDAVKAVKAKGKPIIALCDTCCSAAYWVASLCDMVLAQNDISSLFGSIGVMCSFQDARPYYEKMGYKIHEIYSTHSEHKNESFQLALKGEYDKIIKEDLDPIALSFQEVIKSNRKNLKLDEVGLLTGKTYRASDSLRLGLIDGIGDMGVALYHCRRLMNEFTISNYLNS